MKDLKNRVTPTNKPEVVPSEVLKIPPVIEKFYRPKRVGGYINLYAVEEITVEDDVVVERKIITPRDNRDITMSKISIKLEESLR